jgi:hypothetical protein
MEFRELSDDGILLSLYCFLNLNKKLFQKIQIRRLKGLEFMEKLKNSIRNRNKKKYNDIMK